MGIKPESTDYWKEKPRSCRKRKCSRRTNRACRVLEGSMREMVHDLRFAGEISKSKDEEKSL